MGQHIFDIRRPDEYRRFRWFTLYGHAKCTICGADFKDEEEYFYGRDAQGEFQCTCDKCKSKVPTIIYSDTKKHVVQNGIKHIPQPSTRLWRYLDLAKFVSLLSTRKLYFARLDHFSDRYEGALCSRLGYQKFNERDNFFRAVMAKADLKREGNESPTEEEIEERRRQSREEFDNNRILNRKQAFVCCWNENDNESEALWRLYAKDMKCGIAIQTTYQKLYNALDPFENVNIRRVQYVNYDSNFVALSYPEWYKRKSLEYESEVRAVIRKCTFDIVEYEKYVNVDLDLLIENVVTSPEADFWFTDLVKELCRKYKVYCNVKQSEIQMPVYY
ncbi:MAG: hypothetical protein IJ882_01615 [Paludibacteraceae bacterium]|nr:hypothetical protein [Paludibacteraceae bacterium]